MSLFTRALLFALAILYSTLVVAPAQAQATTTEKENHAMCAAANALLAARTEPGMFRDILSREAKRHADVARELGATQSDLEQSLTALRLAYDSGTTTWGKIADAGQACTRI